MKIFRKKIIEQQTEISDKSKVYFALLSIAPRYEHEVYNNLSKLKNVIELQPLFGNYDLIIKCNDKIDISSIEGIIDVKILKCKDN